MRIFKSFVLFFGLVLNLNAFAIERVLITGAPGAGKTALIKTLEEMGYPVFHEAANQAMKENLQPGTAEFEKRLIEINIENFKKAAELKGSFAFFDRGLFDFIPYYLFFKLPLSEEQLQTVKNYSYYKTVFLLEPWKEIYKQDDQRRESFEEAQLLHELFLESLPGEGYHAAVIPAETTIPQRASLISQILTREAQCQN